MKTKILVTGSEGQLGNEIKVLAGLYPGFEFLFTDIAELDITDWKSLESFVGREKPTAVINCAAYTAVDKAEQEEAKAFLVNSTAAGNLARITSAFSMLLIHISTDYVFDGRNYRPYTEEDPTGPQSVYAKSKFAGEEQVIGHAARALIIRTSWLYSEFGQNFLKTIRKYGKERGLLRVVSDQIGSPTYALDLAKTLLDILSRETIPDGVHIYHYANEGVASWYDFASAILEMNNIRCTLTPIPTKDYPLPAVRPFYSVLDKSKIRQDFGIEIPYWRDSLLKCIGRLETEL